MSIPLMPILRSSLSAKMERALARPLVASLAPVSDGLSPWRREEDESWTVDVLIDYEGRWGDESRDVVERMRGALQREIVLLTESQRELLETSPRDFLNLTPRPESAQLVDFGLKRVGGMQRVVSLRLASLPEDRSGFTSAAIVPNLVQLERQRAALDVLEVGATDDALAPLRALVGLIDELPEVESEVASPTEAATQTAPTGEFDDSQMACIRLAASSPHFTLIHGPPGSGKTKVITAILRDTLSRGGRALVVSPTHVAVDNLVERLVATTDGVDRLAPISLPVRYAGSERDVSNAAQDYLESRRGQRRAATIAERVERTLRDRLPFAAEVFDKVDSSPRGPAPISLAVASGSSIHCGTTIGILGCAKVRDAQPGEFDLLVVDEVSKMTLSDFLAVAVKAKRWVMVGDPMQLPVHNDAGENGETLHELLDPELELICSAATFVSRTKVRQRSARRLLVVARRPREVAHAIAEHLRATRLDDGITVACDEDSPTAGIFVCRPDDVEAAYATSHRAAWRAHRASETCDSRAMLVEFGLELPRMGSPTMGREVPERERFGAVLFDRAYDVYHGQPWSRVARHPLRAVDRRHHIERLLPSSAAITALGLDLTAGEPAAALRTRIVRGIAGRFLVNAASVLDWLSSEAFMKFDFAPLSYASEYRRESLLKALSPRVGRLLTQYRMTASLSRVPRELFYQGAALHDAPERAAVGSPVTLVHVEAASSDEEVNQGEVDAVCERLVELDRSLRASSAPKKTVFVVTPYREQRRALVDAIRQRWGKEGSLAFEPEVFTLDSCQGREADFVVISLVRDRSNPFLDAPKRWNVAVTRAKEHLTMVGDIEAFRAEAHEYRRGATDDSRRSRGRSRNARPQLSVVAGLIEAYDTHRSAGGQ